MHDIINWAKQDIYDNCNRYNLQKVKCHVCKMRIVHGEQIQSIREIASQLLIGKSSVQRHLKVLEEEKWIVYENNSYVWAIPIEVSDTWLEFDSMYKDKIKESRKHKKIIRSQNIKEKIEISRSVKRENNF